MIEKLDSMKKQLADLATVLNTFKSEAVQLRLLEFLLGRQSNEMPGRIRSPRAQNTTGKRKTAKKQKKSPRRMGGQAALTNLLSMSFFDRPRTIKDIVKYCEQKFGRNFKPTDFSGKLSRLAANGALKRQKNAKNKYQYKKP